MNRELAGKIVVFTSQGSWFFLANQSLLSVGHLSANNRYILFDGSWRAGLLPEYPQHLKEITGSDRLFDVFDFLLKNREKTIFHFQPDAGKQ